MALTGELNDLSLAELIEFFCNQRKSGRLKISYECAPGYFFFQNGALADAKIGVLRGVEAVYYALTLENAQFKFSPSFPPEQRTINQPWAQVALEGLRRMDEGITPTDAFPADAPFIFADEDADPIELEEAAPRLELVESAVTHEPFNLSEVIDHVDPVEAPKKPVESAVPLSLMVQANAGGRRKVAVFAAIAAVLVIVAAIGVPAGWYGKRSVQAAAPPQVAQPEQASPATVADTAPAAVPDGSTPAESATSALSATETPKANHEAKDRAKLEEKARLEREKAAAANTTAAPPKPEPAKPGPKMVTVQVSFDENGRVTQASGADATATRIARQRRFPAGKAGTTTVTIPLN